MREKETPNKYENDIIIRIPTSSSVFLASRNSYIALGITGILSEICCLKLRRDGDAGDGAAGCLEEARTSHLRS